MLNRKFIGISLGYNTSAALVGEKGIELAISEERLIGEKNTKTFPINALKKCIDKLDPLPMDQVYIGICSYEVINERTSRYMPDGFQSTGNFYEDLRTYIAYECDLFDHQIEFLRVDHHTAHALPAVYMSGFLAEPLPLISVTYDGFGDGTCATIVNQSTGELLGQKDIGDSVALVYQFVTGALGFKEHQHEGKITGLAAFGEPKYLDEFYHRLIRYDQETNRFIQQYKLIAAHTGDPILQRQVQANLNIHNFGDMLLLKNATYNLIDQLLEYNGATKEDIAATVQAYVERLVTKWVLMTLSLNGFKKHEFNMTLSGGLFANVKVNYQMKEKVGPKNLYILPPMGDEGTAIGAAINFSINQLGIHSITRNFFSKDELYLGKIDGPKLDINSVDCDKYKIYSRCVMSEDMQTSALATLLAEKKIVCMSVGHSEFGPRALGNHSILYDAGEKGTNDSLNKRLSRTEFMPFAPITLDKFANDLFEGMEGLEKSLKYMTVAVPVKHEFIENYKAAYHIDFTARPQILYKPDNPILYRIIEKYSYLSNKKALINTSFNLHNSPIIYSDQVAYESFVTADLDVLVLDDFMIMKKECMI